jgi:hypothetical protein
LDFKNYGTRIAQASGKKPGTWCALFFYDQNPEIHVNHYPNVNLNFVEQGVELSLNAETKPAVNRIRSRMKAAPAKFASAISKMNDFHFIVFYKLQYLPMDNVSV